MNSTPTIDPREMAFQLTEAHLAKLQEEILEPVIKDHADMIYDKLHDTIFSWLKSDLSVNLTSEISSIVQHTVIGIILGDENLQKEYAMMSHGDGPKIREALLKDLQDEIVQQHINDLKATIQRLERENTFYQNNFRA